MGGLVGQSGGGSLGVHIWGCVLCVWHFVVFMDLLVSFLALSSSFILFCSDGHVMSACTCRFVLVDHLHDGNEVHQSFDALLGSDEVFKLGISSCP